MSLAAKVLTALVAGLILGIAAAHAVPGSAGMLAGVLQPVGATWVAAIRMTIIPLVMAAILVAVGGAADTRTVAVLGIRGLALFIVLLLVAAAFSLTLDRKSVV